MDNTMCRIESAIQSIEASVKQQEELLKAILQEIKRSNQMLAVTEGLNSKTAEYLAKNNGQTDPESRDTSTNNSPFGSTYDYLSKQAQTITQVVAHLQSQASNGSNKSSQAEEEEAPKSNEDIKASLQRIDNILTESDSANDFATKASEKSDSDTKGHKQ